MKRILEYSVFDILKDKKNSDFLDKVKEENPDLYAKFLNLVKNKGLEIAKEKYQIYSPEYKQKQKELEKKEVAQRKRERTEEGKEEIRKNTLELYKVELKEINDLLENSILKDIEKKFKNSKNISKLLTSFHCKKQYQKLFSKYDKKPKSLFNRLNSKFLSIELDKLEYRGTYYSYLEEETMKIITIEQVYMPQKHDVYLNFKLNVKSDYFGDDDEYSPYADTIVDAPFINYRNKLINKIGGLILSKNEVYNLIDKLEYMLSDEFKEEWELKNSASKFNM